LRYGAHTVVNFFVRDRCFLACGHISYPNRILQINSAFRLRPMVFIFIRTSVMVVFVDSFCYVLG
jgi:hypothetical protein